ncbi:hypothetical protein [Streptomyces sp. DH37]|uniref:hypothetical protein n=1 Tax=Streptomyces sp. DH37 TaxID=3040122 RepID=UPI00244160F1|nr:hypothetical protein [Streptomyces sp. DH37]MDG9706266.1 hypothetical protein [Streptomyces sp. DH37]
MAISVGSVEVDVIPNTRGIYQRLRSGLVPAATRAGADAGRAAGNGMTAAMRASLDGDVGARIGQQIGRRIGQSIGGQISVRVGGAVRDGVTDGGRAARTAANQQGQAAGGAFATAARARLEAAFRSLPQLDVRLSDRGANADLARLRSRMESLSNRRIGVDVDADTALREITDIQNRLAFIGEQHPNVAVRADTAAARLQLQALREALGDADDQDVDIDTSAVVESLQRATDAAGPGGLAGALKGVAGVAAASTLPALGGLVPMLAGLGLAGVTVKAAFSGVGEAVALAGEDAEEYRKALKKMGPEQRAFVEQVVAVKDGFADFSKEIKRIALPGFTKALKNAAPAAGVLKDGMRDMAGVLGDVAADFGKLVGSGRFRKALEENFSMGADFVREMGDAFGTFTLELLEFGAASRPAFDSLNRGFSGLLSQGLPGFFDGLTRGTKGTAAMMDGLFGSLNERILPALGRLSGQLADTFGPALGAIFRRVGEVAESLELLLSPALQALKPLMDSFTEGMGQADGVTKSFAGVVGEVLGGAVRLLTIPLRNAVDLLVAAAPIVKNFGRAILDTLSPAFASLDGKMGWTERLATFVRTNRGAIQEMFARAADALLGFVIVAVENMPAVFNLFKSLAVVALESFGLILGGASKFLGWIPGVGDKIRDASGSFNEFKANALVQLAQAGAGVENFSSTVTPRLKQNRLEMNIRNWQAQLDTARADLKSVPPSKRSELLARIADLQAKVRQGKRDLASVKNRSVDVKANNFVSGTVGRIARELGSLRDKTITIRTNYVQTRTIIARGPNGQPLMRAAGGPVGFAAGGLARFPTGGQVFGSGTKTSDSILARLSRGEFVIRAAAVDHYGPALFHALNAMQIPAAAQGWHVGVDRWATRPAPAGSSRPHPSGLQPGQPVVLQLEDGPLVRGWVKGIANESMDEGFTAVRRRLEAGVKR